MNKNIKLLQHLLEKEAEGLVKSYGSPFGILYEVPGSSFQVELLLPSLHIRQVCGNAADEGFDLAIAAAKAEKRRRESK